MADRHDKTSQPADYQVGDFVLLSTEHLPLKGYKFPKLTPLFDVLDDEWADSSLL